MDTSQNIYDNPEFFKGYIALRQNPHSANEMLEKPALFSLAPVLDGKRVLDLGCGCGENCAEFFRRKRYGAGYLREHALRCPRRAAERCVPARRHM